jgi:hypothetical protein
MPSSIAIPDPNTFHPPEIASALALVARAAKADIEALQAAPGGAGGGENVAFHEQPAPAALANAPMIGGIPVRRPGTAQGVTLVMSDAAAPGESMTIDVGRNGDSILTAPFTVTSATPADARIALPLRSGVELALGDRLTVTRGYTPGANPTMRATTVEVTWR